MCGEEVSRNPVRVATSYRGVVDPGLPEGNPGLELANAFSVSSAVHPTLSRHVGIVDCFARPALAWIPSRRRQLSRSEKSRDP